MLAAGKGTFEAVPVNCTQSDVKVYGVKCGNKVFVYAYNPTADAKSISLDFNTSSKVKQQLTVYDCETGKYTRANSITPASGKLKIANQNLAGKTDAIYVINSAK